MQAEPELSIHLADVLQPWGVLNIGMIAAEKGIRLPKDWLSTKNLTLQQRLDRFEHWRTETLLLINKVLWPRYDRDRQVWIGESTKWMMELTKTDLQLMLDMQHPPSGIKHVESLPDSPLRTWDIRAHTVLFHQEDGPGIFDSFGLYDRTADPPIAAAMANLCTRGDFRDQDPVNFEFKSRLQRPRPMQMALRLKYFDFEYLDAASSITPSMCSGHCLQGTLDVGAAIQRLLDDGASFKLDKLIALCQWAVDIGDRRVMAGIHYPSDNICSWLLFLRIADSVFHRPEVRQIIGYAIARRSFVYRELHRWMKIGKGNVYAAALAELDRLLPAASFNLARTLPRKPTTAVRTPSKAAGQG